MERCYICDYQGRSEDLLPDLHKECLICKKLFCFPHHSANPWEIQGTKRRLYILHYTDWSNGVHRASVFASELCLICGLTPQNRAIPINEWIRIKAESHLRLLKVFEE